MIIEPTALDGVRTIRLSRQTDDRGWFARSFCMEAFAAHGLPTMYPQHNISFNLRAGTVRGLHFQTPPEEEVKIIRCTRGAIFDVLADVRPTSPTRGQWVARELTASNGEAFFADKGFAHGFQTLSDDTEVSYLMGSTYVPGAAGGIRYDDPQLAIPWPLPVTAISERDRALPFLAV